MKKSLIMIPAVLAFVALAACSPGPAEKAGERADSAIEETTQGQKDLTDGPLENAGEAVDRAAADAKEGVNDVGAAVDAEKEKTKN